MSGLANLWGKPMRTIETRATVRPDGTLVANVPPDVAPGEHRVVLVLDDAASPLPPGGLELPVFDPGPWTGVAMRREDLYGDDGR